MNRDHGLLNERYRPKTLDTFVGNDKIKKQLQKFIDNNDIPNMLFYGKAGVGKTTLAKILVNSIDCDFLFLNASDERGIETIREKVVGFASSASFKPLKIIVLDESDYLTINAQTILRNVIEKFSASTRFIMTCNYVERIIEPLVSRCPAIKITPPSKHEVAIHIDKILSEENIQYKIDDLGLLVNNFYPDVRLILNHIQLNTKDQILSIDEETLVKSAYLNFILQELKNKKPSWLKIRQIIADSKVDDFEELFRFLYDNLSDYLPSKEGMATVYISEHSFQAGFRVDKEINTMSLIAKLIELK
jgi:DNA polymerase III delta prime subunit